MALSTTTASGGQGSSGYRGARSPIGLGGAIAVHGAVLAAFLLMPREMIDRFVPPTLIGHNVPMTPPPPEEEKTPPEATEVEPRVTRTDPLVKMPAEPDTILPPPPPFDPGTLGGTGDKVLPPPPPPSPPADPVLKDAQIDKRALASFQPDYPAMMVRMGQEGSVTVRVTIAADGRVTDIERVSATDEAFWQATMRHALKKWRFMPATRDGVPIAMTKVMTVHFKLA